VSTAAGIPAVRKSPRSISLARTAVGAVENYRRIAYRLSQLYLRQSFGGPTPAARCRKRSIFGESRSARAALSTGCSARRPARTGRRRPNRSAGPDCQREAGRRGGGWSGRRGGIGNARSVGDPAAFNGRRRAAVAVPSASAGRFEPVAGFGDRSRQISQCSPEKAPSGKERKRLVGVE